MIGQPKMTNNQVRFKVADLVFLIKFADTSTENNTSLLPSFSPFIYDENSSGMGILSPNNGHNPKDKGNEELLFSLVVDDSLPFDKTSELIRDFDTGNGHTLVYKMKNGGYQYVIRSIEGRSCCLLQTDADFHECFCALKGPKEIRTFGLNNALMLIFAFAGCRKQALLVHASCVQADGKAYPFIAKSGTGKSTHSQLWLKNIPDTELMNDDNPVIRIVNGNQVMLYGSPWSGKTPCYRNISAPLGAITRIERAGSNYIERLGAVEAFASLLPSCSSMKWDKVVYDNICDTITQIIENVPSFVMHCLPDDEAAIVCHNAVTAGS